MYSVIFDKKAVEFLDKLSPNIKKRIFEKIMSAKESPLHFFERLTSRQDFKLRIGDYRVIADIDENSKQIFITLIGHRKNVYDKN